MFFLGGDLFMEKWVNEWNATYNELKRKWTELSDEERQYYLQQLTEKKELLLDYYVEMDEKLAELTSNSCLKKHYQSKGISYYHLKMYDKAIIELERERKNVEADPQILLYLGFSYLYAQKYEKAKEIFLYIVHTAKRHPEIHFALVGLGCIKMQTNCLEAAIQDFEKALELTMNPDVLYNLGICHYIEKRAQLAVPYFQEVININPEDVEAYYFLGKCFLHLNNKERALETWLAGLQITESVPLLQTIALEFEELGNHLAAIHCYKRLQLLGYNDVSILHGIAWNYGLMGEKAIAKEMFDSLISEHPKDVNLWISYLSLLKVWEEKQLFIEKYRYCKENRISHPLIEKLARNLYVS